MQYRLSNFPPNGIICMGFVLQIKSNKQKLVCLATENRDISFADLAIRFRPRFFDQVGHETMNASSGNKHFFTKSCHRKTYQNYEQRTTSWKISNFVLSKSFFCVKNWSNLSEKSFL